jgi:hypothetical protein
MVAIVASDLLMCSPNVVFSMLDVGLFEGTGSDILRGRRQPRTFDCPVSVTECSCSLNILGGQ